MSTALTVYLSAAATTTLATANQLYTINGTPANTATYSIFGTTTGFVEITAQGQHASGVGTIGAPSGKGFLYDSTVLEGQQFSGSWTPAIRLNSSQWETTTSTGTVQAGTFTADIYMRAYKRSSGGTYTLIVSSVLTAQTINSTFVTYALPATSGTTTSLAVGDKLYIDCWVKVLTNTNGVTAQGVRINRLSTDTTGLTGDATVSMVTPGYSPAATQTTRDISSRVRLLAQTIKTVSTRFRLQSPAQLKDIQARLRMQSAAQLKNIQARFRLALVRDLALRLRVQLPGSLVMRNLALRFLLTLPSTRSLSLRLLLTNLFQRDLALRLRSAGLNLLDISLRLSSAAPGLHSLLMRFRSAAVQTRDLSTRAQLLDTQVQDLFVRFIYQSAGIHSLSLRFFLYAPPILLPAPGTYGYHGINGCIPIPVPTLPYLVNGVALDTPVLCTAPLNQGGQVLAGSVFTLSFTSPSSSTQSLLMDGVTIAAYTFVLADGTRIIAPVQVRRVLTGSLLLATFTVLSTVPISRYVIVTQFF